MHKLRLNTLQLDYTIYPDGPILIKSGVESGADPTLPDMNFVRGTHPQSGATTIYLPGSSLKGVIRSHTERIARTVNVDCCDPLDRDDACDQRLGNQAAETSGPDSYKKICTICRIFGHTVMASHLFIPDAYPQHAIESLPIRQMVAIDRRSGGSVNTFTMEVATEGAFQARLLIHNFERWQIGLLGIVLRDISAGRVGIGFGKSRGLGQVMLRYDHLTITYPGRFGDEPLSQYVHGVAELAPHVAAEYDMMPPANPDIQDWLETAEIAEDWGQTELYLSDHDVINDVFRSLTNSWRSYSERNQVQHAG